MTDNWIWQFSRDISRGFWSPYPCWISSDSQHLCCDCWRLCDDALFPSFCLDKKKPCWLRNSHLKTLRDWSFSLYLFRHAGNPPLSPYYSSRVRPQTCMCPGLPKTIISDPVSSGSGLSTEQILICLFPVSLPASCLFSGDKATENSLSLSPFSFCKKPVCSLARLVGCSSFSAVETTFLFWFFLVAWSLVCPSGHRLLLLTSLLVPNT